MKIRPDHHQARLTLRQKTVGTLNAIRKLKEYGVGIYFEEQNIYTLDGKGEVLLTIMPSIA